MQRLTVSICETQLDQNTTVSSKTQIGVSQRLKSPTHWRNLPAIKPLTVQIPPATGIISTPTGLLQPENLHSLEELVRWQIYQHPNPSTHWSDPPAHGPSGVQKPPMGGGKHPFGNKKWVSRGVTPDGNPRQREGPSRAPRKPGKKQKMGFPERYARR